MSLSNRDSLYSVIIIPIGSESGALTVDCQSTSEDNS